MPVRPDPAVEDHRVHVQPVGMGHEVLRDRPAPGRGCAWSPAGKRRRPRGPRSAPTRACVRSVTPPGAKPPTRCDPKAWSRSRRTAAARAVSPVRSRRSRSSSSAPPCWQVRECCLRPVRAAATTLASSSERSRASATAAELAFAGQASPHRPGRDRGGLFGVVGGELHGALARTHRAVDHAGHPAYPPMRTMNDRTRTRATTTPATNATTRAAHPRWPVPSLAAPHAQCLGPTPASRVLEWPPAPRGSAHDSVMHAAVAIGN